MKTDKWLEGTDRQVLFGLFKDTSIRKRRLFAVACSRRVAHMLTDATGHQAIEAAEKYADGLATAEDLQNVFFTQTAVAQRARLSKAPGDTLAANAAASTAARDEAMTTDGAGRVAYYAAEAVYSWAYAKAGTDDRAAFDAGNKARDAEPLSHCDLIRCIFSNPFRPLTISPSLLSGSVLPLARAIYDERPFERMPVLADALEECGVTDAEALGPSSRAWAACARVSRAGSDSGQGMRASAMTQHG